jgi:hypothetical protein
MQNMWHEDYLRQALKIELAAGHLKETNTLTETFNLLKNYYPVSGSKIAWRHIEDAIESTEKDESFIEFFDRIKSQFGLIGSVLYAGDSLTDFVLEGSIYSIQKVLPKLFEVPQHHYFIGPNFTWCMSMTIEGDMGFGTNRRILSEHQNA